jgi:nucleotide-binding universal stress UspA family protein
MSSTTPLPSVVIAAIDSSPGADPVIAAHIVDVAAAYASSLSASVVVLSVIPPPSIPSLGPLDPQMVAASAMAAQVTASHEAAEAFLLQMATRAQAHGVSTKTIAIMTPGHLPQLINDAALDAAGGADRGLLILATSGRRGLAKKILGSVAEKTAHLAELPVMLLPPPPEG